MNQSKSMGFQHPPSCCCWTFDSLSSNKMYVSPSPTGCELTNQPTNQNTRVNFKGVCLDLYHISMRGFCYRRVSIDTPTPLYIDSIVSYRIIWCSIVIEFGFSKLIEILTISETTHNDDWNYLEHLLLLLLLF